MAFTAGHAVARRGPSILASRHGAGSLPAVRAHDVAASVLAALLVLSFGLTDGGYYGHGYLTLTVLLGAGSLLALVVGAAPRLSRAAVAMLVTLGLFTAWTGLSARWALPGAGVGLEARRSLLYLVALGAVALVVDVRRREAFLAGLLAAVGVVGVVAVAMRVTSGAPVDRFYGTLLEEPVGYPNALGVLAAIGAVLAIGLGSIHHGRRARLAGAAAPFLVFALGLTGSRGAALACALGLALLVWLAPAERRPSISSRIATAFALGGSAWAVSQWRGAEGVALAALALATAIGGWTITRRAPSLSRRHARLLALLLVAASLVVVAHRPPALSSSYRVEYWRAALAGAAEHPFLGAGAGSFQVTWGEHRRVDLGVRDAHSLYVESLSELGPPGLLLVLTLVGVPLAAAHRRRGDALAGTAAAAFLVFAVHAGVDWDWEMPVVTLAGLGCGAVALLRSPSRPTNTTE